MKKISVYCGNCKAITIINVEDEVTDKYVNDVLKRVHCPKCRHSYIDRVTGWDNCIMIDTKLVPSIVELNQKGYLVSFSSHKDEEKYVYMYVVAHDYVNPDHQIDLSKDCPLTVSSVPSLFQEYSTIFKIAVPGKVDDELSEKFHSWVDNLPDLNDASAKYLNRIDVYEILLGQLNSLAMEPAI